MDYDLATTRLTQGAIAFAVALVVVVAAMWLTGWLCRRRGLSGRLTALLQVLAPVALFYAGSLYLDAAGLVAKAAVAIRDERIGYVNRIPGGWNRSFFAAVRFDAPDGPAQAMLWLDEPTFDALHVNDVVEIRYVGWFPHVARLTSTSTRGLVPFRFLAMGGLAAVAAMLLWRALRRRPVALGIAGVAAVALFLYAWWMPAPWETPLAEPIATTDAEVYQIRDVTISFLSGDEYGSIDAPQPWQLVELHFVPEGRDQPVKALDGVDAGSVSGLRRGARVPIAYSRHSPRDVRLAGTRTYRWREWQALGEFLLWILVVVGALMLGGRIFRRLVRGAPARDD